MTDEEFKALAEKKCNLIELRLCPDRTYSRLPTLYNMKNGKLRQWHVRTDNNIISVTFGEVDGRQTLKWTESVAKNIGKDLNAQSKSGEVCKVTGLRTYTEPLKKCSDVRGDDDKCNLLVKSADAALGKGFMSFQISDSTSHRCLIKSARSVTGKV